MINESTKKPAKAVLSSYKMKVPSRMSYINKTHKFNFYSLKFKAIFIVPAQLNCTLRLC